VHLKVNDGAIATPCNEQCATTGYDPDDFWTKPYQAQYYEEIWNTSLDYAGTPNYKVWFQGVEQKLGSSWQSTAFATSSGGVAPDWEWDDASHFDPSLTTCFAQAETVDRFDFFKAWTDPFYHNC
jgi:hypothetical protein